MAVTRIAPTPSGYLHVGNAVNFLVTAWIADSQPGSELHLRIDDINLTAVPTRYLDDIFWAVDWLGIEITSGPSGSSEFRAQWSQRDRLEQFRATLGPLLDSPATFVCRCSRTAVAARGPGTPDPCLSERLALQPGATALRFRADSAPAPAGPAADALHRHCATVDIAAEMGDFVVWRRDDLPAYQLASLLEDVRLGVDTIVRGEDLRPSTAAQLLLSDALGERGVDCRRFADAHFVHHPLVADQTGAKMSKRDNADALHAIAMTPGGREAVFQLARLTARQLDLPAPP